METSFKWCPECAQFVTHVGLKCAGCDMEQEEVDRLAEKELNEKTLESTSDVEEEDDQVEDISTEDTSVEEEEIEQDPVESQEDVLDSDWILCKEKEAVFGGDSKEECESELDEDVSVIRYASGLFFCKGSEVTYWIGRPEAFEESGMSIE